MQRKFSISISLTLSLLACTAVLLVLHSETGDAPEFTLEWSTDSSDPDQVVAEAEEDSEEDSAPESIIDHILTLKAYSIEAKKIMDADESITDKLKSGALLFVGKFGVVEEERKDSNKDKKAINTDIITEYARLVGETMVSHAGSPQGLPEYMISKMNTEMLKGHRVVVITKDDKWQLAHKSFGLRYLPDYFEKLKVSNSALMDTKMKLHTGTAAGAIAALDKNELEHAYEGQIDKLTSKYDYQEALYAQKLQGAALDAIQASVAAGIQKNHSSDELVPPLPVAGIGGAALLRKSKEAYIRPSDKEIEAQAMEEAKKWQQAKGRASKLDAKNPVAVVTFIENSLQGTSVRVHTSYKEGAHSSQSPKIKIVGARGTVDEKFDFTPQPGKERTQQYITNGPIGPVSRVIIQGEENNDDAWLVTKVEVQVGYGNTWVDFTPNGKPHPGGWWVLGTNSKPDGFSLSHLKASSTWLLLPSSDQAKIYRIASIGKGPTCSPLGCVSGLRKNVEKACDDNKQCEGFTFAHGLSEDKAGEGCLKFKCETDNPSADWHDKGTDYWVKQAYEYKLAAPTDVPNTDACPKHCGFGGSQHIGSMYCSTVGEPKKVEDEFCSLINHPKLFVPDVQDTKVVCPAMPPCPTPSPTPPPTQPRCGGIRVYEDYNFGGWSVPFGKGTYPFNEFVAQGRRYGVDNINDKISSMVIDSGCRAWLYQHGDFVGARGIFTGPWRGNFVGHLSGSGSGDIGYDTMNNDDTSAIIIEDLYYKD